MPLRLRLRRRKTSTAQAVRRLPPRKETPDPVRFRPVPASAAVYQLIPHRNTISHGRPLLPSTATDRPWMTRARIAAPLVQFQAPLPAPTREEAAPPARTRGALAPWIGPISPERFACPSCSAEATRNKHGALAVTHRRTCPTRTSA